MLRMRFYNRKKPKDIFSELKFWINRSIAMLTIILFCFVFLLSAASNADAAGAYSNQVIYNPEFQTSDSTLLSYRKSIEQSDKDTFRITLEAVTGQDIKTDQLCWFLITREAWGGGVRPHRRIMPGTL